MRAPNPEHTLARSLVTRAILRGELKPGRCEVCGTDKQIDAHHDDYAKPMSVRWLCRRHHVAHHQALSRAGKGGVPELAALPLHKAMPVIVRRRKKGETLASIGADFGMTRERIRQIVNEATPTPRQGAAP